MFLQGVSEKLFVCVCVWVCKRGKERPENKKESLLFYTIFHSRIWKMNSNRKDGRLSSLSIWFLMQAPELCIIFSTLWWERNIKILLEVSLFFPPLPQRPLYNGPECILCKKSNYHSSTTIYICKFCHYLCFAEQRKRGGKRGVEEQGGRKKRQNEGHARTHTHTHACGGNRARGFGWAKLRLS